MSTADTLSLASLVLAVVLAIVQGIRLLAARHQRRAAAVRNLLRYLEDKRVLYLPLAIEAHAFCVPAIFAIREELQRTITLVPDNDAAMPHLTGCQGACRTFLDRSSSQDPDWEHALRELRLAFRGHMEMLYATAGVRPLRPLPGDEHPPPTVEREAGPPFEEPMEEP